MFAVRNAIAYKRHEESWLNEDDRNPDLDGKAEDLYTDEEDDEDEEDMSDDEAEEHKKRNQDAWKARVAHFRNEVLPKQFPFSLCFKNPNAVKDEEEKPTGEYSLTFYSLCIALTYICIYISVKYGH